MKQTSATFSLAAVLLLTHLPWETLGASLDNFLQCLPHQFANQSYPISEAIHTPQNSSFKFALESYVRNHRYLTPTTPKPLAIIAARHESHVQATIICAKNNSLQIRIRSGGHDLEGVSYVANVPFVILDLNNLRSIDIDVANGTAWAQAGATLGELYYGIANKSKAHAFPAGICFGVGLGGHFTGGGYGNLMRKYGLSIDNIIDARIVNVDGQILDRKAMGEDLFWAIRGGGASSFGVVLSWTINLVRVPEIVTIFRVNKVLEEGATDVVYRWQEVADKLDRDLFIRLRLSVVETKLGNKTVEAGFIGLFLGQTQRLLALASQSFPELGLRPSDCIETSWLHSTLFWYDRPLNAGTTPDIFLERVPKSIPYFKTKSDYVKQPIPKSGLEALWKEMLRSFEAVQMQWNPYGGRMSDIPATATPFPHRAGNLYLIQYNVYWQEVAPGDTDRYMNVSRGMHAFMTPFVSKFPREAFLNYRDFDVGTNLDKSSLGVGYGSTYFKRNYVRLTAVKKDVDPDNFFKNEQSIVPGPLSFKKK